MARTADRSRPVGFVNVMLAPHGACRVSQFGDVLMLNRYYGWYVNTGDLDNAEIAWEQELTAWAWDGKPIFVVTEYGADTYPAGALIIAEPSSGCPAGLSGHDAGRLDRVEAVVGEQVWTRGFATTRRRAWAATRGCSPRPGTQGCGIRAPTPLARGDR